MEFECPGRKQFTKPMPEIFPCPYCHQELEMWTDEVQTTCDNCGNTVTRERLQGCIDWCQSARECLGEELYQRLARDKRK